MKLIINIGKFQRKAVKFQLFFCHLIRAKISNCIKKAPTTFYLKIGAVRAYWLLENYLAALILSSAFASIDSNPSGTGGCHLMLSISALVNDLSKSAFIAASRC